MSKTRIIGKKEAEELLTMADCIDAMEQTLRDISAGHTAMLQRSMMPQPKGNKFALMAADNQQQGICGVKAIVFPGAEARANGTNQGIVPLFDGNTGALLAIVDAECITAVRTAASSAAAARILAREDSETLAILGAGRIGRLHIQAVRQARPIRRVLVWNRTPERAEQCCRWAKEAFGLEAVVCREARQAAEQADIICTVTQAKEPILQGEWLKPGAHINAVGACAPNARELDTLAVQRSRIYLDQREAALRDGGDIAIPLAAGELSMENIVGEAGQVLLGQIPGRRSPEEITLFESVGIAVEDLAAAYLIYQKACRQGLGVEVEI